MGERASVSKRSSLMRRRSRLNDLRSDISVTGAEEVGPAITISTVSLSKLGKGDREVSVIIEFKNSALGESNKFYYGNEGTEISSGNKNSKPSREEVKGYEENGENKHIKNENKIEQNHRGKKNNETPRDDTKKFSSKENKMNENERVKKEVSGKEIGYDRKESNSRFDGKNKPKEIEDGVKDETGVEEELKIALPFNVSLKYDPSDPKRINDLVNSPVLFKLLQYPVRQAKASKKGGNGEKPAIVGYCNLDLLPIVLGEKSIEESLIVQQEEKVGHEIITWPNLPVLTVTATVTQEVVPSEVLRECNTLYFTVESLYNLSPLMTDKYSYQAGTLIPHLTENLEDVHFKEGTLITTTDVEKTKRWAELIQVPGKGSYSKYTLGNEFTTLHECLPIEKLNEIMDRNAPRIEWNSLRRCWLTKTSSDLLQDYLAKYDFWPLEIIMMPSSTSSSKSRRIMHGVAYLNIRTLLYPGVTNVRSAVPLRTYKKDEFVEKTGLKRSLFENFVDASKESTPSVSSKRTGPKSSSSKQHTSHETNDLEPIELANEEGLPAFVTLQVELHKPFTQKRSDEDLMASIADLIPKRKELPKQVMNLKLAEQNYRSAIEEACACIVTEYRNYIENKGEENAAILKAEDLVNDFLLHLHKTGANQLIRNTLDEKIKILLEEKGGSNIDCDNKLEFHNFLSDAYIYLIEEMHATINKLVNISDACAQRGVDSISSTQLSYFAEEALEEGDVETSERFFTKGIHEDNSNYEHWISYSIFHFSVGNIEEAKACIDHVLQTDSRNLLGLLLYGIFLCESEDYSAAETFFDVTTRTYPQFTEVWVILHLFYLLLDKQYAADIALKACYDLPAKEHLFLSRSDPLCWYWDMYDNSSVFLSTAIVLIQLRAYTLAETSLAQELIRNGVSVPYLYYLSVIHYFKGYYNDAVNHLEKAVREHSKDYCLWSLIGHCFYRLKDEKKATEYYEYVVDTYHRPDDIHLVALRLAKLYLNSENFEDAKKLFLYVCKFSPTPCSWLGVGMASYESSDFDDCEQALGEANFLDNECSITWGYLALVNLQLHREEQFLQCYRQAIRYKLNDQKLINRISCLQKTLNFSDITKILSH